MTAEISRSGLQVSSSGVNAAQSTGALVSALVASVIAPNLVTADQYIAIVLPG